ncbi:hypothetical protein SM033_00134 [Vibrio phage vB_VpaM_sm033]|nr:hypothetical protein SM033_00134 [Vibrio phage vB_VpaM_sm033]
MIETIVYSNIFTDDERAQEIAASYAVCGQEEIGLTWLANHSYSIGCALAQYRVLTSAEQAVELLIDLIQEYVDSDYMFHEVDMSFVGQTHMSIEVIWAISAVLQIDQCSDVFFYERIMEAAKAVEPTEDANHLKPI